MRRVSVFLAAVGLFLFGFGFSLTVNAETSRQPAPAASAKLNDATSRMSKDTQRELERIRTLAPNVNLCSDITANSDVSKLIDCLNRVTKFAKSTQKELNGLDRFVTKFFNCTGFDALVVRGGGLSLSGYVFHTPIGGDTLATAVDLAGADDDQSFLVYRLVPTDACRAFVGEA